MSLSTPLQRRSFLRGLGAMIALPAIESLRPAAALAKAAGAAGSPTRLAFMFVPNGMHMPDWTPAAEGADFDLPWTMQPLRAFKNDITVLSGLTQDKGRANGDGGGDHARSAGSWLTGAQPLKEEGSRVRLGKSADQYAAEILGKDTRLPSLELGLEPGRQGGKCDTGYACVYSNNISWRDEATPMTREINPRLVFERLFGGAAKGEGGEAAGRRKIFKKSILDFVLGDAQALSAKVSGSDKHKLDEYLTAVRDIEMRVERAERLAAAAGDATKGYQIPEGIPESFEEHARLMADMMVLAFQTDTTRVCTFMLANEGSNRSYRNVGVNEGHHSLSHHQGDHEKQMSIREINRFHVRQLAYVLDRLKSIKDGDGTLLDHTALVYGAGLADGNAHAHHDLPLLLAGRGGGIASGRHIRYAAETPMCNLLVSLLDRAGAPVARIGDSTGPLRGLDA